MTGMKIPPSAALLFAALLFGQAPVYAETHTLKRDQAKKIIERLGYNDPQIAYIVHGAGLAGPNTATVSGMGVFKGEATKFDKTMQFDQELGWFYAEDRPKAGHSPTNLKNVAQIRIWTVNGYSEVGVTKPQEVDLPADLKTALRESLAGLDVAFQELLEKISPAQKAAFLAEEDQWRKFEKAELSTLAGLAGAKGSPEYQLAYSKAELNRNRARLKQIQEYITDPTRIPEKK